MKSKAKRKKGEHTDFISIFFLSELGMKIVGLKDKVILPRAVSQNVGHWSSASFAFLRRFFSLEIYRTQLYFRPRSKEHRSGKL